MKVILLAIFVFIFGFTLLKKGNISFKTEVKDSLYYAQTLRLDLSQSELTKLPDDIALYTNLEELDLSSNPIEHLGRNISKLTHLKYLKLNHCININFNEALSYLKNVPLEKLEVNNALLTYIPANVSDCKSLKELSIKSNYIQDLPDELLLYTQLRVLDAADNQIDSLPYTFKAMKWLKHLNLSNNPCLNTAKTYTILKDIITLETLELNGAKLITDDLSELSYLKSLSFCNSDIDIFPATLKIPSLRYLKMKEVNKLNYDLFFKSLSNLDSLQSLELSSLQLTELPELLFKLNQLTHLSIANNAIKRLPASINTNKKLRFLKLQMNASTNYNACFESISNCDNLDTLDISYSELKTIPNAIQKLKQIDVLNLEGLQLENDLAVIYPLQQLKELNLRGNTLTTNQLTELKNRLTNSEIIAESITTSPENLQQELLNKKEIFSINPTQSATVTTLDGTIIKIPANAFVDEKGVVIKEKVELNFQPYYSPADIYLSGINMNYDSSNTRNSFISAGMFTIGAKANGKELALNKKSKIKVDFKSNNPTQNFNYYNYNDQTKNWTYKGVDSIEIRKNEDSLLKLRILTQAPVPTMPNAVKPFWAYKNQIRLNYRVVETKGRKKYSFWIEQRRIVDKVKDEVSSYITIQNHWVYEIDSTKNDFFVAMRNPKSKVLHTVPNSFKKARKITTLSEYKNGNVSIDIVPDAKNDCFNIMFSSLNDTLILPAYPDYASAADRVQSKTKKEFDNYIVLKKIREEHEQILRKKYEKERAIYEREMEKYRINLREENRKELAQLQNQNVNEDRIIRSLQLDALGTWNCDIINRLPNGVEIYVRLFDKENQKLEATSITVIDKTNNGFGNFGNSKIILDKYVNTTLLVKLSNNNFGYTKLTLGNTQDKEIDLVLNILDTKKMSMQAFNKQVFN
jgi:Leucine-rich repeat (LRR) protein